MSIVGQIQNGWLLDHDNCLKFTYSSMKLPSRILKVIPCNDIVENNNISLRFSRQFFRIESQFVTDGHFDAGFKRKLDGSFKMKRKKRMTNEEGPLELYHDEIQHVLRTTIVDVQKLGKANGLFIDSINPILANDNNVEARSAAASVHRHIQILIELNSWDDYSLTSDVDRSLPNIRISGSVSFRRSIANILVTSETGQTSCYVQLGRKEGHIYLVPPNCSFLMSDITFLQEFADTVEKFDLIIMDPPWFNKSVKRKKSYWMLDHDQIREMPIKKFANEGALVGVWTTNNHTCLTVVRDEFFPTWDVEFVAEWHWLKFTTRGETICDLDSHHKRPYEHLIIGQRRSTTNSTIATLKLQNHRVICSIPSSLHSHKPPLHELLKPYMRRNGRCLELFSRYLLPGWTSWGNEAILLQHIDFYDHLPEVSKKM